MRRMPQLVCVVAAVAGLAALLTSCGGGSSSDSSKTASSGSNGSNASTSTGNSNASQKSGSLCANIKQADVQALLPSPIISAAANGVGDCTYREQGGGSLDVTIYTNDPDEKYYKGLAGLSTDQQLSGVGDEAYWNEPAPGHSPPEVSAHRMNQTCVIQSNDPPDTTMKVTITNAQSNLYNVADADSSAYAALLGKVCADYLNGI